MQETPPVQSLSGKIPHAAGWLSLCATTAEAHELYSPQSATAEPMYL